MVKKIIPLAAMERIMKKAGAKRVSEDAKETLRDVLEEFGIEVSEAAIKFAFHTGRKTVKAEDIKLATR
ncbi:MAG: histone family protein [Nanoarchaeota archaeon]|nr:histone family protein [Nanoarchaeota archaeon]MBU1270511.1 histone family protein [Nanoarchaeota archaeon]MBU1604091.1 histone family protein [Nanoarchaeota archaeon]MBU2443024.1 histone family protein [Nanoarchaeota archaeon]